MNWDVWRPLETAFVDLGIRPVLAVVPDNKDPVLQVAEPHTAFWELVRGWQARGWTIALHGYQHRMVSTHRGLVNLNPYSEFAGCPATDQRARLVGALEIFRREGIQSDLWIAPAHSFDISTLMLLREFGITSVSDGYGRYPWTDANQMFWVPQQLASLRPMPSGVWTVCIHLNGWSVNQLNGFVTKLSRFRSQITSFDDIATTYKGRSVDSLDRFMFVAAPYCVRLKRQISALFTPSR